MSLVSVVRDKTEILERTGMEAGGNKICIGRLPCMAPVGGDTAGHAEERYSKS